MNNKKHEEDNIIYVNEAGVRFRLHTDNNGKLHIDIYDVNPREKEHESIHINVDENGKGTIVEKIPNEKRKETYIKCYLTTACMMHYLDNFDDNCYELRVLRWFRDNYVSKEDIETYYKVAPIIVEGIEEEDKKDIIYNYIYDNVVDYCVKAIEEGDYEKAYTRYKSSIVSFEETFARNVLNKKIVKMLKR